MTALVVEAPAIRSELGRRLVVRGAGRPVLHVALEGVTAPVMPVFTVALECAQDAERAPGVRPWAGPVTEASLCPACLRSLRGEPEPEQPRLVPAGVAQVLPEPAPERGERRLRAVPDLLTYSEAPLPREHGGRPITWSAWTKAPIIHCVSSACEWCGDPGAGEMAGGRQGNPMSRTDPLRRYMAYRCTACQEMTAYEQVGGDLKTIAYHRSRAPKGGRA